MNHTCLHSPAAEHHRSLWLVLISRPAEFRRLSWSGWLGEIPRWFVRRRRSPISREWRMAKDLRVQGA